MPRPPRYQALPQIDPGAHVGQVAQMVATPDGRRVATAGDTTVRVWHIPEQRHERMLLGQVHDTTGDEAVSGRVLRMAISPDGRWLVAIKPWRHAAAVAHEPEAAGLGHDAGWVAELQVFDVDTGNLCARHLHPGQLLDVDISRCGRWLACAQGVRHGRGRQVEVAVYALRELLRRARLPAPVARVGIGSPRRGVTVPTAVRFVPPARAAAAPRRAIPPVVVAMGDLTGARGLLAWLRHAPATGLAVERSARIEEPIASHTLSVSAEMAVVAEVPPGGRKLRGRFHWHTHDGAHCGTVGTEAPPAATAFSPSGRQLAVGLMLDAVGGADAAIGSQTVQVSAYDAMPGGGVALCSTYYGHDGTIGGLAFAGDKAVVSCGGDNQALHVWSPARRIAEAQAVLRGIGRIAIEPGITADERVLFGSVPGRLLPPGHARRQQSFDLRRMALATTAASDIRWNDYVSRKWWVAYDDGPLIDLRFRGDTDEAMPERAPDLTLFVGADDQWVIWTRSGYYDAGSPDAAKRIGYRVNRGPRQEALLIPSDRFKAFYRPDLVRAVVKHGSEDRARAAGVPIPRLDVTHVLPPIVELAPRGVRRDGGRVGFALTIESPCPDYLPTRVSVLRNDRVVWVDREPPQRPLARCTVPPLPLLPGANRFAIHAENAYAKSVPLEFELIGPDSGSVEAGHLDAPGRLYLLAVGVAEFADPGVKPLNFPHRDAQAVHDAFAHGRLARPRPASGQPGNRAFESVDATLLVNRQATKAAILAELDRMCAEIHERHRRAGAERDVLFVFMSGHGTRLIDAGTGSSELFFQNYDLKPTFQDVAETGLSMLDLGDRVTSVPAEVVLVIDACHAALAGQGVVAGLDAEELARRVQAIHERGMYLVSAARSDEIAREDTTSRYGVLTASLLAALHESRPRSRSARQGLEVLMAELMAGVQRILPEVTARAGTKAQTPVCRVYGDLVPLTILKT